MPFCSGHQSVRAIPSGGESVRLQRQRAGPGMDKSLRKTGGDQYVMYLSAVMIILRNSRSCSDGLKYTDDHDDDSTFSIIVSGVQLAHGKECCRVYTRGRLTRFQVLLVLKNRSSVGMLCYCGGARLSKAEGSSTWEEDL